MEQAVFKRVLLKLSGEALMGDRPFGIDPAMVAEIAREIGEVVSLGVEMGVVIGGGNIFRGFEGSSRGMERTSADYMGMIATVINCLAMQSALEQIGVASRVMTAIEMKEVAEPYLYRRAMRHLEKKRVVIFAGGTGNPYFTTDTAAALRALEIKAEIMMKATKVDGVYDKDPVKFPDATKLEEISYTDVLARQLRVLDATAVSLLRDGNLPLVIFNLLERGNIKRVVCGERLGSWVRGEK